MIVHFHDRNDQWDTYLAHMLRHNNTWLGALMRKAYGYTLQADPRKSRRATKKYADGRQKKGGK